MHVVQMNHCQGLLYWFILGTRYWIWDVVSQPCGFNSRSRYSYTAVLEILFSANNLVTWVDYVLNTNIQYLCSAQSWKQLRAWSSFIPLCVHTSQFLYKETNTSLDSSCFRSRRFRICRKSWRYVVCVMG